MGPDVTGHPQHHRFHHGGSRAGTIEIDPVIQSDFKPLLQFRVTNHRNNGNFCVGLGGSAEAFSDGTAAFAHKAGEINAAAPAG